MAVQRARDDSAALGGVVNGYAPLNSNLKVPFAYTYDPITTQFGIANTAYEFETSSFTGLTALAGTPTVETSNTLPSMYVLADNNGGYDWCGRYITPPATPYTAMVKLQDFYPTANYHSAGIFIGVATPGNMDALYSGYENGMRVLLVRSTQSAFSSTVASIEGTKGQMYLAIVVNSSSSVDYYCSLNGYNWRPVTTARNPSITIASVGICLKSESGTYVSASFDFFRVWNSALTLV